MLSHFTPRYLGSPGCRELTQANTSEEACFKDMPAGIDRHLQGTAERSARRTIPRQGHSRQHEGGSDSENSPSEWVLWSLSCRRFSYHPSSDLLLTQHNYSVLPPSTAFWFQGGLRVSSPMSSPPLWVLIQLRKCHRSQIRREISASEVVKLGWRTKRRLVIRGKHSTPSPQV